MLLAIEPGNSGICAAGIHFNKTESPELPGVSVFDKIYPQNFAVSGKELTHFLFTPTER